MVDDVAWAAGLFEGEGCVYIERKGYVRLVLSSTDLDVLERFQTIFDCGGVYEHKGAAIDLRRRTRRHKTLWAWRLGRANEVEGVLRALLPWLGTRRRAKVEEALRLLEQRRAA